MDKLRQLLYENLIDPNKIRATLQLVALIATAGALVLGVYSFLVVGWAASLSNFALGLVALFCWWLVRLGRIFLPAFVLSFAILITIHVALLNGNGIHDVAVLFYPILLAFVAMLLGRLALLVMTGFTVVSIFFVIHAEVTGAITTPFHGVTDYSDIFVYSVAFSIQAALLWIMLSNWQDGMSAVLKAEETARSLNANLEARVHERTAEMQAALNELEAFSYSVSHDLRSPLRAMAGFSSILLDGYREKLDAEGISYVNHIHENALKMGHLIDALLNFSRLGRQPLRRIDLDMTDIVRAALDAQETEILANHAYVTLHPLPVARGDADMLKLVWSHFISNALKFTRADTDAHIEIGSLARADGKQVYYIRDNGIGFDMKYADRLFGVFQQIHTEQEGGSAMGIGLATAHRIIRRHGGDIWAESTPLQGATFYFTLS